MGTVDVPAFIDFVLEKTGLETLSYIGHSESTTQMFMGLSLMPEYFKQKVNLYVALAPAVFIRGITDPATLKEAKHWKLLQDVLEKVHLYNIIEPTPEMHQAFAEVCTVAPSICKKFEDKGELLPEVDNMSRELVMYSNFPSGSCYRLSIYYGQCVSNGGHFREFDYGSDANMALYG